MNILLIVDPQNDFITGSLAIEGAIPAMDYLTAYVKEHHAEYDAIVVLWTSILPTTVVSMSLVAHGLSTASAILRGLLSILLCLMRSWSASVRGKMSSSSPRR